MEGTTPKQEGLHNVQGLLYTLCNGEEKRQQLQQESRCATAGSGRSCGHEDNSVMVKHTADQSCGELPGHGRSYKGEDSPVSVILAASKHWSHPSSECTSMEHPLLLHHSKIICPPGPHFRYGRGTLPSHEPAHYIGSINERVQQAFSKSHELTSVSKRVRNLDLENIKKASQACSANVVTPWSNYSTKGTMEWLNLQEDPPLSAQTCVHSKVYPQSRSFASSPDNEAEGFSVYCSSKDQDEESVIDFFPSANRSSSALQLKRRSHDGVVNAQEKGNYGEEEEDAKRVSLQSRRWGVKKMNKSGGRHDGITAEEAEEAGTRRSGSGGRVSCSSKWGDAERWLTCGRSGPPPPLLITNGLHFIALPKADVKYASEDSKEPKGRRSGGSHREAGTEVGLGSMRDMATQSTPTDWSRCDSPSEVAIFSTADEKVTIPGTCPEKGTSALKVSPPRHNTPARRSVSCSRDIATKPSAPAAHVSTARKLNLLELENCHLDKLKLARDLPLGTSSTWQLCPDEDIVQSLNSTDHKTAYESAKAHQHAKVDILQARVSAWEEVERAKHIAKFKREEAKIEAWESLQRAEADAELRKLEVKLEKLRFEGREKIMGRLASAQRRAQEMRSAAEAHQVEQLRRVGMRANHIRKSGHLPSSTFNVVCSLTTKIKPTSSLSFG